MGFWPFSGPDERHQQGCAGWKYIAALDIPGHVEKTAGDVVALLTAPHFPIDTVMDIIIAGSQLAPQVHESCGHPIELDRVTGAEAAYAAATRRASLYPSESTSRSTTTRPEQSDVSPSTSDTTTEWLRTGQSRFLSQEVRRSVYRALMGVIKAGAGMLMLNPRLRLPGADGGASPTGHSTSKAEN